jgi:penicillin G amidase
MMVIIRRILAGFLLLALLLAGGLYLYLRSSLPQVEGRIVVQGINRAVMIARDGDGVPLITAANDADAAFGLGVAHAQDRLFQMEMMRRYGAGRLSEVLGVQTLGVDRQMRVLGLYRLAEAEFPMLSAPVRRGLEAYAAGVNAFLATRSGALPPEFLLLRFTPDKWRPADSLVWGKLMDLLLAGNYRGELLRARLARTLSPEELAFLYPQYPKDGPTTLAQLRQIYRRLPLDPLYAALPPAVGPIYASNNWVVDGAHSASGKPLLANDPHLGFGAPGFWYLARLKTPQREIAGGTAPGTPFVVIGRNDRIAWGFTTTGSDVEDLFIEKLDPADPNRYLTPDGSAAFASHAETIVVRGMPPVRLTVRTTRHGPVLSDALPAGSVDDGYVLSLAATFLAEGDTTAQALWGIDRATDWPGFRSALQSFVSPMQNMVYGDSSGTIGFIAPGRIPVRKRGNGWLPVPGWTGEYDWNGTIPFADLPQASQPASGHFISANNKIVPDSYRYFLSRDWDLPNRAERIGALLAATPKQSPATSAAIQADTLSLAASRLVPLMTRIVPGSEPRSEPGSGPGGKPESKMAREAIERLRAWDFHMDAATVEPLLFTAWLREFAHQVFFRRLGDAATDYWSLHPQIIETVLSTHPEWCGSPPRPRRPNPPPHSPLPNPPPQAGEGSVGAGEGTGRVGAEAGTGTSGANRVVAKQEAVATCDALLTTTLGATLAGLRGMFGPDMTNWQWGGAHVAEFPNHVFGSIPVLRDWVAVGIASDGGFDTVNRGSTTIRDDTHPYTQRFGAGLRIITDLAAPAESRMIVVPGQSGNPLSPHFSDLLHRWRQFDWLVPGRAAPISTLTLAPP